MLFPSLLLLPQLYLISQMLEGEETPNGVRHLLLLPHYVIEILSLVCLPKKEVVFDRVCYFVFNEEMQVTLGFLLLHIRQNEKIL